MADVAPTKLHDHAVSAEKHLEALATGLGQMGADDGAVKAVSSMAEACRRIVKSLAKAAEAQPAPEQRPTMESATNEMMAERAAARQEA